MNQFPIPKTSSQTLFKCTQTRRCALKKKKKKKAVGQAVNKTSRQEKGLRTWQKYAKPYEVLGTWKTVRTDNKLMLALEKHNFRDNRAFFVVVFFS